MSFALHVVGAVLAAAGMAGLIMLGLALQSSPNAPWAVGDRLWALGSTLFLAAGAALLMFL